MELESCYKPIRVKPSLKLYTAAEEEEGRSVLKEVNTKSLFPLDTKIIFLGWNHWD